MAAGKKTGGRKAGTPNKMTKSAKEAFQIAFDELGGHAGLVAWALMDNGKNIGEFYKLYARLIPIDIKADIEGKHTISFNRG